MLPQIHSSFGPEHKSTYQFAGCCSGLKSIFQVRILLILFNTMKVEVFSQKQNLNFVERQAFASFKHGFFQV